MYIDVVVVDDGDEAGILSPDNDDGTMNASPT
jgi:hypothetical protein